MIETTIYKCEYCGVEFDDEYEAHCHEWVCQYNDIKKRDGSVLRFYNDDGTEIKFDDTMLVDARAFIVGNDSDVKFVKELFNYYGYKSPFNNIENSKNPKYYGLWWFDPDLHYGKWVRVDDQIKKWVGIENKFIKGA